MSDQTMVAADVRAADGPSDLPPADAHSRPAGRILELDALRGLVPMISTGRRVAGTLKSGGRQQTVLPSG